MEILKVQRTEDLIRQVINESQLDVCIIRYMVKEIYDEINDIYYQLLKQEQQKQFQGGGNNGDTVNGGDDNT